MKKKKTKSISFEAVQGSEHNVELRRFFILHQYTRCCLASKREALHLFSNTFLFELGNLACNNQLWTTFKVTCQACHMAGDTTILCCARTFFAKQLLIFTLHSQISSLLLSEKLFHSSSMTPSNHLTFVTLQHSHVMGLGRLFCWMSCIQSQQQVVNE